MDDDEAAVEELNNLKTFINENRLLTAEKDPKRGYKKNYRKDLIEEEEGSSLTNNPLIRRYNIM
jgi:hypothetical protein